MRERDGGSRGRNKDKKEREKETKKDKEKLNPEAYKGIRKVYSRWKILWELEKMYK